MVPVSARAQFCAVGVPTDVGQLHCAALVAAGVIACVLDGTSVVLVLNYIFTVHHKLFFYRTVVWPCVRAVPVRAGSQFGWMSVPADLGPPSHAALVAGVVCRSCGLLSHFGVG